MTFARTAPVLALVLSAAMPAAAQGQAAPASKPPAPAAAACAPEHAAMGHCAMPAPPVRPDPSPAPACAPEHAAMGHCTPPARTLREGTDLAPGDALPPPVPADRAADAIYGAAAMHRGHHHLALHHGGQNFGMVLLDKAEVRVREGKDAYAWEGEAWYGGDINRLTIKTEGEGVFGAGVEAAEVQALYSRAVNPYFDFQAGLRYDIRPGPSRVYAAVGVEGLAPGFIEVEGAVFLSDRGEVLGRVEASYDQRITQTLILQPRVEADLAAQTSGDIGIGRGLSTAEFGARLRYDIAREFAPYVGIHYERAFGRTRALRRDLGEDTGGFSLLVGVRAWF